MIVKFAKTKWRMSLADRYQLLHLRSRIANDNEPRSLRLTRHLAELETALVRYRATFEDARQTSPQSAVDTLRVRRHP